MTEAPPLPEDTRRCGIDYLQISYRTHHALKRAGFVDLSQLEPIPSIPGLGSKSKAELRAAIAHFWRGIN